MVFSQSDIDILKLICWCQYVKPEKLRNISDAEDQKNLLHRGLIQQHEKSGPYKKRAIFFAKVFDTP